jgi:hypothetical protein
VIEGLQLVAAVVAWLGASVGVLADGRRGVSVGLLLAGAGLAAVRLLDGSAATALLLAAGAVLGALASLRANPHRGWGLLPPGSTPRVVACIVLGGGALWFAAAGLADPSGWTARAADIAVAAVAAARVMTADEARPALAAAAAVALGLGSFAAATFPAYELAAAGAAAAVAVVLAGLPVREAFVERA